MPRRIECSESGRQRGRRLLHACAERRFEGARRDAAARWTLLEANPQQLSFIFNGDCDLIDQLKDLISSNFSLKDLEYRTTCMPRQIYFNGFAIKAQGLIPVPPSTSAATS